MGKVAAIPSRRGNGIAGKKSGGKNWLIAYAGRIERPCGGEGEDWVIGMFG